MYRSLLNQVLTTTERGIMSSTTKLINGSVTSFCFGCFKSYFFWGCTKCVRVCWVSVDSSFFKISAWALLYKKQLFITVTSLIRYPLNTYYVLPPVCSFTWSIDLLRTIFSLCFKIEYDAIIVLIANVCKVICTFKSTYSKRTFKYS